MPRRNGNVGYRKTKRTKHGSKARVPHLNWARYRFLKQHGRLGRAA